MKARQTKRTLAIHCEDVNQVYLNVHGDVWRVAYPSSAGTGIAGTLAAVLGLGVAYQNVGSNERSSLLALVGVHAAGGNGAVVGSGFTREASMISY